MMLASLPDYEDDPAAGVVDPVRSLSAPAPEPAQWSDEDKRNLFNDISALASVIGLVLALLR